MVFRKCYVFIKFTTQRFHSRTTGTIFIRHNLTKLKLPVWYQIGPKPISHYTVTTILLYYCNTITNHATLPPMIHTPWKHDKHDNLFFTSTILHPNTCIHHSLDTTHTKWYTILMQLVHLAIIFENSYSGQRSRTLPSVFLITVPFPFN